MTSDEALQKFGLPSSAHHRDELRRLLAKEVERERRGVSRRETAARAVRTVRGGVGNDGDGVGTIERRTAIAVSTARGSGWVLVTPAALSASDRPTRYRGRY